MTRRRLALAASLTCMALTACDYEGAQDLPLPGAVGTDGYRVTVVLDDATNLVTRETCRANDVVVGSVESIELDEQLKAEVVCRIRNDVELPANIRGTLRETSLLGERYVALDPPPDQEPAGVLEPGSVIPAAETHVVPDTEVVLGALSQVLNGGGLASIDTINRELNAALGPSDFAGTMRELRTVVDVLDDNRTAITDALESLDRLSRQLAEQRSVIGGAIEAVPGGLAVLDRQRPRLVESLESLSELSQVAVPLIRRSKADTVAGLRHLAPVLEALATEKDELARAVERIVSFPFPSNFRYVTKGDYAGMFGTISLDIDSLNTLLAARQGRAAGKSSSRGTPVPGVPGLPGLPDLPELPELPGLPDAIERPGGLGTVGGQQQSEPPSDLAELLTAGAT